MKARQIIEDENAKDFIMRRGVHPRLACSYCFYDLSKRNRVKRVYTSDRKGVPDVTVKGHYKLVDFGDGEFARFIRDENIYGLNYEPSTDHCAKCKMAVKGRLGEISSM